MADPATMGVISLGTTAAKGFVDVQKAGVQAQAQNLAIQGQMMKTMADAFGMEVQAEQYGYDANKQRYQAAVADMNKEIAKSNAAYSVQEGEVEAEQAGMKARADLGEMVASRSASGTDVNVGSNVRVTDSMTEIGYYNQQIIRASAAKKAYGYDIEAVNYGAQADIYRYTATENEAQAGEALKGAAFTKGALGLQQQALGLVDKARGLNITGSIVGTAGSIADKWTSGSMSGLIPG